MTTRNGNGEWKTSQAQFMGFVRAKLEDIENQSIHISSKVDRNLQLVEDKFDKLYVNRCEPRDRRLRAIEKKQWIYAGGIIVAMAIISWAIKVYF